MRAFLVPAEVLYMRTTAVKWNIAGLYGLFAEICFFLVKKNDGEEKSPPTSRDVKCAIRLSTVVRVLHECIVVVLQP